MSNMDTSNMDKKIDILDLLKLLMRVFDDMDKYLESVYNVSKKYEKEFESLKDINLEDLDMFNALAKEFSEKDIPVLMKVFAFLVEFESKYKLTLEEKQKEANDVRRLIKDVSINLHKILDGKK